MALKNRIVLLYITLIVLTPFGAYAHVKWFAQEEPIKESIETILSPLFLALALFIAILLGILTQLLPSVMKFPFAQRMDKTLAGYRKWSRYLLKYGTALALVLQVLSYSMFAPEFKVTTTAEIVWIWVAILILLIPHHIATKIASMSLLVLFF